jgi:hypothetical protein
MDRMNEIRMKGKIRNFFPFQFKGYKTDPTDVNKLEAQEMNFRN